MIKIITLY
jgi:chromosome segregation ATPase